MSWQDAALLLGGEVDEATGVSTIDLLTKTHGRRRGSLRDGADKNLLERGCHLEIELDALEDAEASTIIVEDVTHTTGNAEDDETETLVMAALKSVAHALIPLNMPDPELYEATQDVVRSLAESDPRWPLIYARWEFQLLSSVNVIRDMDRCRPAMRHGETAYYSPRSNRFFTRTEAGAFLDKVLPVPSFLIAGQNAIVAEVKQALDMAGEILARHALDPSRVEQVMATRAPVLELVSEIETIPRIEKPAKSAVANEADIKRRLLASRPLRVGYSVTATR
jgi:DNA repair protein RecO (recombination protein O)